MSHSGDEIAVVVCSYELDDIDLTLRVLRSAAQGVPSARTVLVDSSPDGRVSSAAAGIVGVSCVRASPGRALGEYRQRGVDACGTRYVAFLDADALPRSGWLEALHRAVSRDGVAVAGGPVVPVWPSVRIPKLFRSSAAGSFLSMLNLGIHEQYVPRVLPGNMAVDLNSMSTDMFDPKLGRASGSLLGAEETDAMTRIVADGGLILYAPGAAVDHATSADRMNWRWMWRRVFAGGRESVLVEGDLAPMPGSRSWADRLFLACVAPAYLAGRIHQKLRRRV